jgi:uncharacterized protein (DUF924 family)
MKTTRIDDILDYWIGAAAHQANEAKRRGKLWYQSTPASDDALRQQFGADLAAAERGELDDWQSSPSGSLALVILLDQFSRNLYRGTAAAFANDAAALTVAERVIDAGADRTLSYIGRAFLYHPFEHAESKAAQDRSVELFTDLANTAPAEWQGQLNGFLSYARDHRQVVHRFGRFPHRNRTLQRESTAEEETYLRDGGKRYGQ